MTELVPFDLTAATGAEQDTWCELLLARHRANQPEHPEPARRTMLSRMTPDSDERIVGPGTAIGADAKAARFELVRWQGAQLDLAPAAERNLWTRHALGGRVMSTSFGPAPSQETADPRPDPPGVTAPPKPPPTAPALFSASQERRRPAR